MFRPTHGRILIKPDASELEKVASAAGLLLSGDAAKDKPLTGEVMTDGETVKTGDRVLFSKFAFDEFEQDGQAYLVVHEDSILGIF